MPVQVEHSVDRFGREWDALFDTSTGPQTSRAWFAATELAAIPPSATPYYLGVKDGAGPLALFALLRLDDGTMQSLTSPYTCLWSPLLREDASREALTAAIAAVAGHCRTAPVTCLEALDPEWPKIDLLCAGFQRAGLIVRTYDHFANWFVTVSPEWDDYLRARPGALRETIRRKSRAVERDPAIRIETSRTVQDVGRALDAYEAIYARSWKKPEPYPEFNALVTARLAGGDSIRMFVLWLGDRPLAAQYWTVSQTTATVLKLAHDETEKRLSPGTVLTAFAIRRMIEEYSVSELDFGRGDDPYKEAWTGSRRQRIGFLGLHPWRRRSLATLVRHDVGGIIRRVRQQQAASSARCTQPIA